MLAPPIGEHNNTVRRASAKPFLYDHELGAKFHDVRLVQPLRVRLLLDRYDYSTADLNQVVRSGNEAYPIGP
jgi:hypothetical protein